MKDAKSKILLIDDDAQLLRQVQPHLEALGYEVATASDGVAGLELARSMIPDLVVLDINFPDSKTARNRSIDGIEILQRLRESGNVPILMLSASNIAAVKVMTLTIGADDYLAKPFDLEELSARIAAILRRGGGDPPEDKILSFRRLRLDPSERRVWKDGELIEITRIEFDILYTLARRPEHVFTREKLIEHAWKSDNFCDPKTVDVHIGYIRKKIEDDPSRPTFIITARGTGYRFQDVPAQADSQEPESHAEASKLVKPPRKKRKKSS